MYRYKSMKIHVTMFLIERDGYAIQIETWNIDVTMQKVPSTAA